MNEKFYGMNGANSGGCSCGSEKTANYGPADRKNRVELLRNIQKYNFMMIEAGLFLNNQPCCEEAQEAYSKYRKLYLETLAEYEVCYGPLTYSGIDVKRDGWKWSNTPWPWEVEGC